MRKLLLVVVLTLAPGLLAQQRELKPGFNLFSIEQDIQMGKEYAAQVEKEMPVVKNAELNAYFAAIGEKLAATPEARMGNFPFTFKVIHDPSINAFALPGGPTFMNTGLIAAADNEAQIAGVVAHEMAHVVLRHGTNQASKSNLLQLPALLLSGVAGDGISGKLAQLGIGFGAGSVIMKFSRGAERDADLLGARIMHAAGYNPIEMARFFEKLEAEAGKGNWITEFFASHPNPGNRVQEVQKEIQYLPAKARYDAETGDLARMKEIVKGLGDPPKPAANADGNSEAQRAGDSGAAQSAGEPAQTASPSPASGNSRIGEPSASAANRDPAASRPARTLRRLRGNGFTLSYPSNWEVFDDHRAPEATIAPRTALFPAKDAGIAIGYGMIVGVHPSSRSGLQDKSKELFESLKKANPNLRTVGSPKDSNPGGRSGLLQQLASNSPYGGGETDLLLTVDRPDGLFYILFISPDSDYGNAWPSFERVIGALKFN